MSFVKNIGPISIESMAGLRCIACPSCQTYNSCFCDIFGIPIIDYALSDWGKSGYKVSAAISNTANESGVMTPWSN